MNRFSIWKAFIELTRLLQQFPEIGEVDESHLSVPRFKPSEWR